jgi:hypothetical protein
MRESSTSITSSSGKNKRISSRKSPSFAPFKDFEERGRLPQTSNDDVLDNIHVTNMEFVTHNQPDKYMAQMPHPDERIS